VFILGEIMHLEGDMDPELMLLSEKLSRDLCDMVRAFMFELEGKCSPHVARDLILSGLIPIIFSAVFSVGNSLEALRFFPST
jgi:hypothetical protein